MHKIVVFTVITLFALATARCANAGVMLGESPAVIGPDASLMSVESKPLHQEKQKQGNFHQGESSGMSGFSVSVSQTYSQSAAVGVEDVSRPHLFLSCVLKIANEVLPVDPALGSLLKPS
ncbi:MAG TPA: hypothetical protein DDZ51_08515 [Planctomycetaceae bacterium]|nr:hypothetical protein [Planctomycetaceae bacterium]